MTVYLHKVVQGKIGLFMRQTFNVPALGNIPCGVGFSLPSLVSEAIASTGVPAGTLSYETFEPKTRKMHFTAAKPVPYGVLRQVTDHVVEKLPDRRRPDTTPQPRPHIVR